MKRYIKLSLLILMCMCFVACSGKEKSGKEASPTEPSATMNKEEGKAGLEMDGSAVSENEVIWTVDDFAQVPEENVKKLNQALYQKGYDVAVRFEYINEPEDTKDSDKHYQKELVQRIKNQETDIVNCGWETDELPGGVVKLIRKGYFLPLDQWLSTEEGKPVYQLYDEEVWKACQVDGVSYTLPNEGIYDSSGTMVAVNTQYIPKDFISSWDGTWDDLFRVLEKVKVPKDIMLVAGCPFWYQFAEKKSQNVYDVQDDLVYDVKEAKVFHPFMLDEFHSYLSFLNRCYKKGWLSKVEMGGVNRYTDQESENIANLKYGIHINSSVEDAILAGLEEEAKEKIIYEPVNFCVGNHIGLGTAVCANSTKTEAALVLLKALRTDDDLANLLVWGSSDQKKMLGEDGKVSENNRLARGYSLGLYDGIFQETNSPAGNMREYKKEMMQSEQRVPSALAGFYPNYSGMEKELEKYGKTLDRLVECWKKKDFEKEYQKAVKTLKPYEDSMIKKINKQINEWRKCQG